MLIIQIGFVTVPLLSRISVILYIKKHILRNGVRTFQLKIACPIQARRVHLGDKPVAHRESFCCGIKVVHGGHYLKLLHWP